MSGPESMTGGGPKAEQPTQPTHTDDREAAFDAYYAAAEQLTAHMRDLDASKQSLAEMTQVVESGKTKLLALMPQGFFQKYVWARETVARIEAAIREIDAKTEPVIRSADEQIKAREAFAGNMQNLVSYFKSEWDKVRDTGSIH